MDHQMAVEDWDRLPAAAKLSDIEHLYSKVSETTPQTREQEDGHWGETEGVGERVKGQDHC